MIAGQWFYFKAQFEGVLPQLEARAAAAGFDVQYSKRGIHGFPFRLEARYQDFTVSKSDASLSFAMQAKQAVLIRQLLRHDLSLLYLEAPQFAASADGPKPRGQTGEHVLAFSAPAMQTSLRSVEGALARVSAVIDLPEGRTTLFDIDDFAATQMQFHMNWPIEGRRAAAGQLVPRVEINMQAANLDLKSNETAPLPSTIAKVQVGGLLSLAEYYRLEPAGLRQWQDDNGVFAFNQFDLNWGDVTVNDSKAQLSLDGALRLKGQGYVTVTGLPALTYAVDKADVFQGDFEEMALLTLRLARAGASGETPVKLDFNIDGGIVRVGPAPLIGLGPFVKAEREGR